MSFRTAIIAASAALCAATALPVFAKSGDVPITGAKLDKLIRGKAVSFPGGTAYYHSDGSYQYGQSPSNRNRGTWEVKGQYACITFTTMSRRCDRYILRYGDKIYLINGAGREFRARIR